MSHGEARAKSFSPGHITGLFIPVTTPEDVLARGSMGAGVVLEKGAWADVTARPASMTKIVLRSGEKPARFPITRYAMDLVLSTAEHPWEVKVDISHDLPISRGFGMSAAGTLSASLALAAAIGASRAQAISAAHLAEVEGHGGLGGIPAILGGGIEVRRIAGIPPIGLVEWSRCRGTIVAGFLKRRSMPSPPLLSDPKFLSRVAEAGKELLNDIPHSGVTLEKLMASSSTFTDSLGLASRTVSEAIGALRAADISAAQAMLGHTVFSCGRPDISERILKGRNLVTLRLKIGKAGSKVFDLEEPSYVDAIP